MTAAETKTIVLARIIESMFVGYGPKEKTRLHRELEGRLAKGLRKQRKQHGDKDLNKAITLGREVWYEAVDHFEADNLKIEASNMVLRLINEDERQLIKKYQLNPGKIGEWAKPFRREDAAQIEKDTGVLVKYIVKILNEKLDIKEDRKSGGLKELVAKRLKAAAHGK